MSDGLQIRNCSVSKVFVLLGPGLRAVKSRTFSHSGFPASISFFTLLRFLSRIFQQDERVFVYEVCRICEVCLRGTLFLQDVSSFGNVRPNFNCKNVGCVG